MLAFEYVADWIVTGYFLGGWNSRRSGGVWQQKEVRWMRKERILINWFNALCILNESHQPVYRTSARLLNDVKNIGLFLFERIGKLIEKIHSVPSICLLESNNDLLSWWTLHIFRTGSKDWWVSDEFFFLLLLLVCYWSYNKGNVIVKRVEIHSRKWMPEMSKRWQRFAASHFRPGFVVKNRLRRRRRAK